MSLESVFKYVYPLLPHSTGDLTDSLGMIGRYAPLVGFIAAFTGVRLNRWMRGYQILLLAIPVLFGLPLLKREVRMVASMVRRDILSDAARRSSALYRWLAGLSCMEMETRKQRGRSAAALISSGKHI